MAHGGMSGTCTGEGWVLIHTRHVTGLSSEMLLIGSTSHHCTQGDFHVMEGLQPACGGGSGKGAMASRRSDSNPALPTHTALKQGQLHNLC